MPVPTNRLLKTGKDNSCDICHGKLDQLFAEADVEILRCQDCGVEFVRRFDDTNEGKDTSRGADQGVEKQQEEG
jgi:hypothetical protein